MPPRLVTKGDMTSRRVLSVVFKILKCTSHLGIGLAITLSNLIFQIPPFGLSRAATKPPRVSMKLGDLQL